MNLKTWSRKKKFVVGFLVFIVILLLIPSPKKETPPPGKINVVEQTISPVVQTAAPLVAPMEQVVTATITPNVQTKPTATPAPTANVTVSQSNALKKAKAYLAYSAFSHDGLVAQLEYEQFSRADAVYGADNVGANWNEQAAKKAKQYMDNSAFSRGSLIDQLKYEKFTQAQAEYGANSVGL